MKRLDFRNNEKAKAALNILTILVSMLISLSVGFFLTPYIVNSLGVEANGFIQLATQFTMYAGLITTTVNSMAGRFISISYHKGDLEKANSYYSSTVFANIFIALILLIPFLLAIVFIDSMIQIDSHLLLDARILFGLVFLNFYFVQFIGLINVNIYVDNRLYITNIINSVRQVARGTGLLLLFTFFPARMFFTTLTSVVISVVLVFVYLILKKRILPEIKYNRILVKRRRIIELVKSGVWNTVNQGGNILMTGLDLLLANIFVDPIQMGILATAKVVPTIIINMATNINNSLSPTMVISYAKDNTGEILSQVRYAAKIGIFCMIIPILLFCVYGQEFFHLWVPSLDAKELWLLAMLTMVSFIPFAGTQTLYNVLSSMNKLSYNSITFLGAGFINVVVVYVVLKTTDLGLIAIAGVSSAISIIRNLVFILPYIASLLEVKWYRFYYYVFLALWSSLLTGGTAYLVKHILPSDTWMNLSLSVLLSLVLVVVINFFILLNMKERQRIVKFILTKK